MSLGRAGAAGQSRKNKDAHFEDVSQGHGSVREAVHEEGLQQTLDVVG